MNIFFTSDTHLGHKNIIRYCNRPFKTIDEMNEAIIKKWNDIVNPCDTVYHLGDFSFGDPICYRERLKGKIILIKGNHDFKLSKAKLSCFESVHDMLQISVEKTVITLCHYAMRVWSKSHFNAWHLYGHSHGMLKGDWGKSYDVGVDNNSFSPISFDELKKIMETKPNNGWNIVKTEM